MDMVSDSSPCAIAPYCEVLELNGTLNVGFGSIGLTFTSEQDKTFIYRLLASVGPDRTIDASFLATIADANEQSIVHRLRDRRLIVPSKYIPAPNRNHRDHLYYLMSGCDPQVVAASLQSKSVCIIGCGGIGCMVAITLATAGVGKVILMDDDVVELHNLSRQFTYTEHDVGRKKAAVLGAEIRKRSGSVMLEVLECRAEFEAGHSNVPRSDFTVFSADQRGLISGANRHFVRSGQAFMHICYINDIAAWGPLVIPGKTGCWNCQHRVGTDNLDGDTERTAVLKAINANYISPAISPVSLIATSMACLDIVKYLSGVADPLSLNQRVCIWTNNLSIEYQDFSKNAACPICRDDPSKL